MSITVPVQTRLDAALAKAIDARAKDAGITRAEVVRAMLEAALADPLPVTSTAADPLLDRIADEVGALIAKVDACLAASRNANAAAQLGALIVAEAQARAARRPTLGTAARMRAADQAVAFAAEHISERDAVFTAATLERQAGDAARGHATNSDIVAAIARTERAQNLVIRTPSGMARGAIGYTTREAIAIEQRLLAHERQGRTRFAPLHDRIDAARIVVAAELTSAEHGHAWTEGQRAATKGLLLSSAATIGVQGSAGTAKTTTVLKEYARAARAQGFTVRAIAQPPHSPARSTPNR
jgi:Ribbon-helix-helix protein, copG family